jgi:hypothetical protein
VRERADRPITSFARWLGDDVMDGDRAAIVREREPRPGTSRSPGSTSPAEELRRRGRARTRSPVRRSAVSLDSEADVGDRDDVHEHLGGEAPHLGLRRPPLGHTPATGHPKELAERLQAYAAREGVSSG